MGYKVSSAPEDAFHMSGSFADGWGRIVDAKALVFQYPPQKEAKNNRPAGHQDPPALYCELTIQRYNDGNGNASAAQPETKLLGIAKPNLDSGQLDVVPGNYPDGNLKADPADTDGALGSEGNTVVAMREGYQFNDKCGYMTFCQSLTEDGFKPEILKATYFPNLIGLYAYFETVTKAKFRADQTADPTAFVVKKGTTKVYPYEKGAGAPSASRMVTANAAKGRPPAATRPAPAPATAAAAPAAASNGTGDLSPEEIATALITETLAPAKKGMLLKDLKKLRMEALMCMSKHKPAIPADAKKAVQDTLSEEWLEAIGAATGTFEVQADGQIQFAS
jgi:hypothetical protein